MCLVDPISKNNFLCYPGIPNIYCSHPPGLIGLWLIKYSRSDTLKPPRLDSLSFRTLHCYKKHRSHKEGTWKHYGRQCKSSSQLIASINCQDSSMLRPLRPQGSFSLSQVKDFQLYSTSLHNLER